MTASIQINKINQQNINLIQFKSAQQQKYDIELENDDMLAVFHSIFVWFVLKFGHFR